MVGLFLIIKVFVYFETCRLCRMWSEQLPLAAPPAAHTVEQTRFPAPINQIFTIGSSMMVWMSVISSLTVFTDKPINLCKWEQPLWLAELLLSEGQVEAEWVEGQMQQLAAVARTCLAASSLLSLEGEAWRFCCRFTLTPAFSLKSFF